MVMDVAQQKMTPLPADLALDAEVDLNVSVDGNHFLRARLNVPVPGVERSIAQGLVDAAHQICPILRQRGATSKSPLTSSDRQKAGADDIGRPLGRARRLCSCRRLPVQVSVPLFAVGRWPAILS